jgi:hypothetical protein
VLVWSALAERSGDTAFNEGRKVVHGHRLFESAVVTAFCRRSPNYHAGHPASKSGHASGSLSTPDNSGIDTKKPLNPAEIMSTTFSVLADFLPVYSAGRASMQGLSRGGS